MSTDQKFYFPLKIGLLIVTISYFLFTFHVMFTLSWIGEWERIAGTFSFRILIEDISATIGLIFRFIGSIIAITTIIYYLAKKKISKPLLYKIMRWIIVFEGIYWLGLIATVATGIYGIATALGNSSATSILSSLFLSVIPAVVESVAIPVALFMLAHKLSPAKPVKPAIKWAHISGTLFALAFWLVNTGIWSFTLMLKGFDYILSYPQNMLSFMLTTIGLLALTTYSAYITKSSKAETLQELNLKAISTIILALGFYYLANYLIWIFFGGDYVWSIWYAWLLGHNLDLWMLSLPLAGIPLLFLKNQHETKP